MIMRVNNDWVSVVAAPDANGVDGWVRGEAWPAPPKGRVCAAAFEQRHATAMNPGQSRSRALPDFPRETRGNFLRP